MFARGLTGIDRVRSHSQSTVLCHLAAIAVIEAQPFSRVLLLFAEAGVLSSKRRLLSFQFTVAAICFRISQSGNTSPEYHRW